MINWKFYPLAERIPPHLVKVIEVLEGKSDHISSSDHELNSNDVLATLREDLEHLGYIVERGSKDRIRMPVLYGENGKVEKSFDVDAYDESTGTVIEVEAGRGVTNHQFLKDFFEACTMHDVEYCTIAVRNTYLRRSDFKAVASFMDALYASGRISLPLKGLLVIGY
ncbi:MAG: hypothetical protein AB1793_01990 [Candidatus Thermoplasmatota archaeon]